jgi:hypothetical protein
MEAAVTIVSAVRFFGRARPAPQLVERGVFRVDLAEEELRLLVDESLARLPPYVTSFERTRTLVTLSWRFAHPPQAIDLREIVIRGARLYVHGHLVATKAVRHIDRRVLMGEILCKEDAELHALCQMAAPEEARAQARQLDAEAHARAQICARSDPYAECGNTRVWKRAKLSQPKHITLVRALYEAGGDEWRFGNSLADFYGHPCEQKPQRLAQIIIEAVNAPSIKQIPL